MRPRRYLSIRPLTSAWLLLKLLVHTAPLTSVADTSDVELGGQYVRDFDVIRGASSPGGWIWENPQPQGNDLHAVFVLTDDDVWAGGRNTLMHWDGKAWQFTQPSDAQWPFYVGQIWASDPQHVWALVDRQVLQWNGSIWVNSGLADALWQSVWGVGPEDVWAAGEVGVYHWDGGNWSNRSPEPVGYWSLWGIASDDVTASSGFNHCFHWNGSSWTTIECPPAAYQGGAGPGEPWFFDYDNRDFLRLHSGIWERYPSPFPEYRSVWSLAVDDAWAVGHEQYGVSFLLHFDGNGWSSGQTIPHQLTRLGGTAPDDVWAVGERGAILRFNGTFEERRTGSAEHLSRIFGFSENELWAVGRSGTVLRRNAREWERISIPSARNLFSISGVSPTDLWVVGEAGTSLHFDGDQWSVVPTGVTYDLAAVWASSPTDVWASDFHSTGPGSLFHWDGMTWSRRDHTGINGFWGFAPDDVWTAGVHCYWMPDHSLECYKTISHFDGVSWTAQFVGSGGAEGFSAIWGAEPDDLWAVGSQTYHWDGKNWARVDFPDLGGCAGVWGRAKHDVFAVCAYGVAHWDGSVWSRLQTPNGHGLWGIWGLDSKVWVVGENGTIIKYEPDKGQ